MVAMGEYVGGEPREVSRETLIYYVLDLKLYRRYSVE